MNRTEDFDKLVLKRLKCPKHIWIPFDKFPKKYVTILDTETTGISDNDEPVQLSLMCCKVKKGELQKPFFIQTYYREPNCPMSEEAFKTHGIEPSRYAGTEFPEEIESIIRYAVANIAHNSGYDRKMLTKVFPSIKASVWGCSQQDINWNEIGFSSRALEFILFKYGYFYEAHDALIDTQAVWKLLRINGNFKKVMEEVKASWKRIIVTGNTYPLKDFLWKNGFRWNRNIERYEMVVKEDEMKEATRCLNKQNPLSFHTKNVKAEDRYK